MVMTLRPGLFVNRLCKKSIANLDELRQKASKYMQLEELREYKSQAKTEASGEKGKENEKERPG